MNEFGSLCSKTREHCLRQERADCICDAEPAKGDEGVEQATINELRASFEGARDDSAVRGVILTGAGEKAFAGGADIAEIANNTAVEAEEGTPRGQALTDLILNSGESEFSRL